VSTAQYGSLKFNEAISFFKNKVDLPSERWADVWRDQHNLAFTVAGATKTDLLADMRKIVDASIAEGKSLKWFQSEFKHLVKKHGWDHTGTAPWRANIIYSTNMRQSYNAGRYAQLQNFEFWRYKHGDSRYPRPDHAAKDGVILPKDSPFWQVWFPQNGWGCKCKVFGESARSMKRRGLNVSKEPVIETREWIDKVTGQVHQIPKGIDPGFDYAPGKVDQVTKLKTQRANTPPLAERLPERMVPTAFSTLPSADVHGLNRVLSKMAQKRPELNQVSQFVKDYDIKTLFLKPSEITLRSKNHSKLAGPITEYLGVPLNLARRMWPVPPATAKRANGYTSKSWDHMVVKIKSGASFSRVTNTDELLNAAEAVINAHALGKPMWSVSQVVRDYASSKDNGGAIITWLHELGHQVHFKALDKGMAAPGKQIAITRYSAQNTWEWHAEHFVMWALARPTLLEKHPDIAQYFDELMDGVNE
tara:strand:- start:95346 stop:96770 length:1425 start_codon:yes stop_codon:yes gene_type:complete